MTGHQNKKDVARKQTCSTPCQNSERNASSNITGVCQTRVVATNAIQQLTGWNRKSASFFSGVQPKNGLSTPCNTAIGKPNSKTRCGAPNKISGGMTIISSTC